MFQPHKQVNTRFIYNPGAPLMYCRYLWQCAQCPALGHPGTDHCTKMNAGFYTP